MNKQKLNTYGNNFSKIALTKTQAKATPRLKKSDEKELGEWSTNPAYKWEPSF